MLLTYRNSLVGAVVYSSGDGIAALLSGDFQLSRYLGMMLIGSTLYAIEIPHYFAWLDNHCPHHYLKRALLAQAFFNPVWIARHFAFIHVFSAHFEQLNWALFSIATQSFLHGVPFALSANYLIQRFVPLKNRFWASATFSALMAIYYPLSERLFN